MNQILLRCSRARFVPRCIPCSIDFSRCWETVPEQQCEVNSLGWKSRLLDTDTRSTYSSRDSAFDHDHTVLHSALKRCSHISKISKSSPFTSSFSTTALINASGVRACGSTSPSNLSYVSWWETCSHTHTNISIHHAQVCTYCIRIRTNIFNTHLQFIARHGVRQVSGCFMGNTTRPLVTASIRSPVSEHTAALTNFSPPFVDRATVRTSIL